MTRTGAVTSKLMCYHPSWRSIGPESSSPAPPTRPMSPEFADIPGVMELRAMLHEDMRAGQVVWCRLNGLSAGRGSTHAALLRMLKDLGLGGEFPRLRPHTVVLDWSTVGACSADGLAFFAVLVRVLSSAGMQVVLCEPGDGDVARILDQSGLRAFYAGHVWIPCPCTPSRRTDVVAPAAVFGGSDGRGNAEQFVYQLDQALDEMRVDPRLACLLSGICVDLVQNVHSHAGGVQASAVSLQHSRRRPPVVEIGMADGGDGIAAHLLSQERHAWLTSFTDATVVEAVFGRALSGRGGEAGGGGLSRLIRRLRDDFDTTVVVRSGAGLLSFSGPSVQKCACHRLTCGWGTQTLISVRVRH
jgi:hypothetical protein